MANIISKCFDLHNLIFDILSKNVTKLLNQALDLDPH